uniref:Sema domain-containing protein n=1 Tax=Salarias fasciatus TaxID=181472 RepID=A0A672G3G1_SALFA
SFSKHPTFILDAETILFFTQRQSNSSKTNFLCSDSGIRPLIHFSLPDVSHTTTLLLSADASTLYVGAQDALLSLDVSQSDAIRLRKQVGGRADCLNFVHVLQQMNSSVLYACGSFAFNPREAYISLSVVHSVDAKGRCPFSPSERSSAVFLGHELFTATTTDFRGTKPQISRFFSKHGRPDVSLDSSISLLEDPTFINSWSNPSQEKIYFFFSEVGTEFNFVEKLKIARVAQVCKDDVGGQRTLQKKWTSFAKAPLLCQSSRQLPFSVLQDVFTLQPPEGDSDDANTLFYGVFTSQWSTRAESAVCVFRLRDIQGEFNGRYRTFDMQSHQLRGQRSPGETCGLAGSSDTDLAEVKRSFLTGGSGVKPVGLAPLVVSSEQRYIRVAAMRTRDVDGRQHTVLFLLTESGFLHKVALSDSGPRIIEEIQVVTKPEAVQSLVLSPSKGFLYVGTSQGVTSIPVAHCSVHRTCSQCLLARDPLCGWHRTRRACAGLSGVPDGPVQDLDGGKVDEECGGQTTVHVALGEVVNLRCQKPSNQASVSWTSHPFKSLSEKLFIRSADGSLRFLAAADTMGTYRCEAEEGGHREVVSSYEVQQTAQPRSLNPLPRVPEEPYEDIVTENPELVSQSTTERDGKVTVDDETVLPEQGSSSTSLTSKQDPLSVPQPCINQKSYGSELVVVSVLLVFIAAAFLGLLYLWCRRKNQRGNGKPGGILDRCFMSGPDDGGPDLKVEL